MKRLLLAATLALCAAPIYSQTAPAWNENDVRVTPPTTCSNGQPVSQCPVTGYAIERAAAAGGPWAQVTLLPPTQINYRHVAAAGQNCYRAIATAAPPLANSLASGSEIICKTNVAPPVSPSPPGIQFVTIPATTHSLHNVTPVVTILSGNRPGTYVGQVSLNRVTLSGPLFNLHERQHCRVEVSPKEMFKKNAKPADLINLAAACAPRA